VPGVHPCKAFDGGGAYSVKNSSTEVNPGFRKMITLSPLRLG
jgi:hypothetical protein